jgi:hypothetical protein
VRSIVTLIAAVCVATAGQGRFDELRTRDRDVATLAPAHTTVAAQTHRRDLRRDVPFVAAASPEIAAPVLVAVDEPPRCAASLSSVEPPAPCSRGPPRG